MPPYRSSGSITQRRNMVLLLLADGMTSQEIADELGVSHWTAKHDVTELKRIFGAKNTNNLIALAYQKGVLNGRQFID